eukprot:TRINITY_DN66966_c3_g1_i1.p1 TRINITY_DN66966_c3_g1~~TRINITY_DN66966_c3_g1_i1.p1  ORF type:complete len:326 (-),score=163.51 TRINITY_DN66966_c3_g1_i1:47-1024(-)
MSKKLEFLLSQPASALECPVSSCPFVFRSKFALLLHMYQHEFGFDMPVEEMIHCTVPDAIRCATALASLGGIRCRLCNKWMRSAWMMHQHLMTKHNDTRPCSCPICRTLDMSRDVTCRLCRRVFHNRIRFIWHVRTCHSENHIHSVSTLPADLICSQTATEAMEIMSRLRLSGQVQLVSLTHKEAEAHLKAQAKEKAAKEEAAKEEAAEVEVKAQAEAKAKAKAQAEAEAKAQAEAKAEAEAKAQAEAEAKAQAEAEAKAQAAAKTKTKEKKTGKKRKAKQDEAASDGNDNDNDNEEKEEEEELSPAVKRRRQRYLRRLRRSSNT